MPPTSFLRWLRTQTHRTDTTGFLARAIVDDKHPPKTLRALRWRCANDVEHCDLDTAVTEWRRL